MKRRWLLSRPPPMLEMLQHLPGGPGGHPCRGGPGDRDRRGDARGGAGRDPPADSGADWRAGAPLSGVAECVCLWGVGRPAWANLQACLVQKPQARLAAWVEGHAKQNDLCSEFSSLNSF